MQSEFYIGYLEKAPKGVAKFIRILLVFIFAAVITLAYILSRNQRGFNPSNYEYYQETKLTGRLISEPFPAIQVFWGVSLGQPSIIQTIPIVGFGKNGGQKIIAAHENKWVDASGHLIYYDGSVLLEIPRSENLTVLDSPPVGVANLKPADYTSTTSMRGEIIDSKCFFGVMKPGHGKPHRSCAIRCISGGIPAVFRTENEEGNPVYYLINSEIDKNKLANYVGEFVTVQGMVGTFYDWKLLKIQSIEPLLSQLGNGSITDGIALCGEAF
ncbi:MAG: hypothetical protein DHS20C17_26270 [Cyclobacteriaceae bacterium]|nr:MAG: hypothetical protein DHS20C17_26270 [Cyclobacteriaceae bacterium]